MTATTEKAREIAEIAALHAERHDADGSFVTEGVDAARELGYLAAAVPVELGGDGASLRDLVDAQRVIGRACGSTALACSMHQHVTLAAAWRWNHGDAVVEGMLRRVADGAIVASSGGNDWVAPTSVATRVDGGWRVDGRKTFVSLAPVANAVATFAVVDEPRPGAEVLAFGLPLTAEGVSVEETWDAFGMRGTGSHDVVLDGVFVADAQITGRRTWGELDRPLMLAGVHAFTVVAASYLGVAEGLARSALATGRDASARAVGVVEHDLRVASWALAGALDDLGDDITPDMSSFLAVQHAKLVVLDACRSVADAALDLAGGRAFARPSQVTRMVRDLHALRYHPIGADELFERAGAEILSPTA